MEAAAGTKEKSAEDHMQGIEDAAAKAEQDVSKMGTEKIEKAKEVEKK